MDDNMYIPPHERVVDSSEETESDAGGYGFVFYDRPGRRGEEEAKKKKPVVKGPPVQLNLSKEALEKSRDGGEPEEEKKTPESGNQNKDLSAPPPSENPKKTENDEKGGLNIEV